MGALAGARRAPRRAESCAAGSQLGCRKRVSRPRPQPVVWVIVAGVFDMTANALYLLAARDGLLSIVAPVSSLYPVSTVILAMLVDRERMRPVQTRRPRPGGHRTRTGRILSCSR